MDTKWQASVNILRFDEVKIDNYFDKDLASKAKVAREGKSLTKCKQQIRMKLQDRVTERLIDDDQEGFRPGGRGCGNHTFTWKQQ